MVRAWWQQLSRPFRTSGPAVTPVEPPRKVRRTPLAVERLEERETPARLYLDFGLNFPIVNNVAQLAVRQGVLRDIVLNQGLSGPDFRGVDGVTTDNSNVVFRQLDDFVNFDFNGDGINGDAQLDKAALRTSVLRLVTRYFRPFNVDVVDVRTLLGNGRNQTVAATNNILGLTGPDGAPGSGDAYVFVGGAFGGSPFGTSLGKTINAYGTLPFDDFFRLSNDRDDTGVVYADNLFDPAITGNPFRGFRADTALAFCISKIAAHSFGVRAFDAVGTGDPDLIALFQTNLNNGAMIDAVPPVPGQTANRGRISMDTVTTDINNPHGPLLYTFENYGMFTRYPQPNQLFLPLALHTYGFNTGTAAVDVTGTLRTLNGVTQVSGSTLPPNQAGYVTGTGADDLITITKLNATTAQVTIDTLLPSGFTLSRTYLLDATRDFLANGIRIDCGGGNDTVVMDGDFDMRTAPPNNVPYQVVINGMGGNETLVGAGGNQFLFDGDLLVINTRVNANGAAGAAVATWDTTGSSDRRGADDRSDFGGVLTTRYGGPATAKTAFQVNEFDLGALVPSGVVLNSDFSANDGPFASVIMTTATLYNLLDNQGNVIGIGGDTVSINPNSAPPPNPPVGPGFNFGAGAWTNVSWDEFATSTLLPPDPFDFPALMHGVTPLFFKGSSTFTLDTFSRKNGAAAQDFVHVTGGPTNYNSPTPRFWQSPGLQALNVNTGEGNDTLQWDAADFRLSGPGNGTVTFDAGGPGDADLFHASQTNVNQPVFFDLNDNRVQASNDTTTIGAPPIYSQVGFVSAVTGLPTVELATLDGANAADRFLVHDWHGNATMNGNGGNDLAEIFFLGERNGGTQSDVFNGGAPASPPIATDADNFIVAPGAGGDTVRVFGTNDATFGDYLFVSDTATNNRSEVVQYATTELVNVIGQDGADSFSVIPGRARILAGGIVQQTTIRIDGGLPTDVIPANQLPGDKLVLNLAGIASLKLDVTSQAPFNDATAPSFSGQWRFARTDFRDPVQFTSIELLSNIAVSAAGTDRGTTQPTTNVYDQATGQKLIPLLPYEFNYTGGVRVAMGEVSGDILPDLVTAPGSGRAAEVKVFDRSDLRRPPILDLFPFGTTFTGGAFVAVGNVTGSTSVLGAATVNRGDVVIGSGAGIRNQVKIFDVDRGAFAPITIFPYEASYVGGVHVTTANVDGVGNDEVIVSPDIGRAGEVKIYRIANGTATLVRSFLPYGAAYTGGVWVAATTNRPNGVFQSVIATGTGFNSLPTVNVYNGQTGALIKSFLAFDSATTRNGVRVAWADVNEDGIMDLMAGQGPGDQSLVRFFNGAANAQGVRNFQELAGFSYLAFDPSNRNGVFVAGSRALFLGG